MKCPECSSDKLSVIETRTNKSGSIRRRRKCCACGDIFRTKERIDIRRTISEEEAIELKNKLTMIKYILKPPRKQP
jgi:transcriptional regulator NrdR family protein